MNLHHLCTPRAPCSLLFHIMADFGKYLNLNERHYPTPKHVLTPKNVLTPEQVTEKIGKNFSVLRSDGKLDNVGWIVDKCLRKEPRHTEDEYEVTVIKIEKGNPIIQKVVPFGTLKNWNKFRPHNFKEIMTAEQLSKYLGKSMFTTHRSNGDIEENCWIVEHCYQLHPQDSEDNFVITLYKSMGETCTIKITTLRELKTWNNFPTSPIIQEKRREFNAQLHEVHQQFSKEMREKYPTK